jgi:L-seryl-tRNA(Ser) seleniumtransferase
VHPSNFRIHGFTERPTIDELVSLGKRFNITVAEDLGSGYLGNNTDSQSQQLDEPTVRKSVAAGTDVVCFSADKLLGGPQAGILVGQSNKIERIRAHPLMRALRVDKLTYAALGATLQEHAAGQAHVTVPVSIMLSTPVEEIGKRAQTVVDTIESGDSQVEILNDHSAIGGGSAPETHLPTKVIAIQSANRSADYIQTALRKFDPPIIGRIDQDRVLLDLRTVLPEQDKILMKALGDLLSYC